MKDVFLSNEDIVMLYGAVSVDISNVKKQLEQFKDNEKAVKELQERLSKRLKLQKKIETLML